MGNHDDGAALGQFGKRLLDQRLVLRVSEGGCLIQHHDGGVLQNGPGQRDALLLTAGEIGALGADQGVHALGEFFQDVSALGRHQGGAHLIPAGVRLRGPDILHDGGLEQAAVLEHKRDLIHEHMRIHLPHIHAAHPDSAGGYIPEPGDQAGRRGLASAGGSHQGHRLPRLRREGHMGEGGAFRSVIGEAHIRELHTAVPGRLGVLRNGQRRRVHDRTDAPQGGGGQHHTGGREHDPGQSGGDDGGEHRVKGKVRDKPGEAPGGQGAGGQEQRRRDQEHKGSLGKGQVDGLGHPAYIRLIVLRLGAVLLDGLLERLEGPHRLLEDLHHRDAPDILGARLGHPILGGLVFGHKLCVFAAHHGKHGEDGDDCRQQAGAAHPPVKDKHQGQHGHKQGNGAHDVCQVMGQQRLGIRRSGIQPSPDETGGVGVEPAQRGLHHMGHAPLADVGRRAKRRQMGTHQAGKIQRDPAHLGRKRHPAVPGDALGRRPVRGNLDQIPGRQPDTDVGRHAQQHGRRRQGQPQKGQPSVAARIVQQGGHIALFLLLHKEKPPFKLVITNQYSKKTGVIPPSISAIRQCRSCGTVPHPAGPAPAAYHGPRSRTAH